MDNNNNNVRYVSQAHLEGRMSESERTFEEELSMDLFSDVEVSQSTNTAATSDCKDPACKSSFVLNLICNGVSGFTHCQRAPCPLALTSLSLPTTCPSGRE